MCRHFAYLGEQVAIKSVLVDPPHSLVEQAWAPRWQRHGTMNVDGFGIGWYTDGDPLPARYRRAGPIWSDDCLPDLARVTRTRAMLCAVRSASVGTDTGAAAAAPYAHGSWLFSLNGALVGWSAAAGGSITPRRKTAPAGANAAGRAEAAGDSITPAGRAEAAGESITPAGRAEAAGESITPAGRAEAAGESITEPAPSVPADLANAAAAVLRLADALPAADLLGLQARCDTALLWGMVLPRLRAGTQPADALAGTVGDIWAAGGTGRFNLLLTDGQMIAATAAGDSLCYRYRPDGVIVASEPSDDDPDWLTVPDDSVLEATTAGVTVRPITRPSGPAGPRNQPASYPNGKVTHP